MFGGEVIAVALGKILDPSTIREKEANAIDVALVSRSVEFVIPAELGTHEHISVPPITIPFDVDRL
jgi:hypothetical protein